MSIKQEEIAKKFRIMPEEAGLYPADDIPQHMEKILKRLEKKPRERRTDLEKGNIVVVLEGEFTSMRVVFLKQLENNLALCTGPITVNGVPFFKIDERFLLKTSTVLKIGFEIKSDGKDVYESKREDKESKSAMEKEDSQEEKKINEAILNEIKKHKCMKTYLSTPFKVPEGRNIYEMNF